MSISRNSDNSPESNGKSRIPLVRSRTWSASPIRPQQRHRVVGLPRCLRNSQTPGMRSKIRVEIFVKGSCTRCGYDRLIKINTVSSSDPPGYFCHSCGALRLKTEITEHQTFLTSHMRKNPGQRLGGLTPAEVFNGDHTHRWDPTQSDRHTRTRDRPGLCSVVEEPL